MKTILYLCIDNLKYIIQKDGDRFLNKKKLWDKYNY